MTSRALLAAGGAVAAVLIGGSATIAANSGTFGTGYDTGVGRLAPVIAPQSTAQPTEQPPTASARTPQPRRSTATNRPSRDRTTPAPPSLPAHPPVSSTDHENDTSTVPGRDDDD